MGFFYQGFHADMARTIEVKTNQENQFLKAGKRALKAAIKKARPGNRVGHLSLAIEREIKKANFWPVESLTGHGIGKKLHEPPAIPCFLKEKISQTPRLCSGMVLAVEVIYTQGKPELILNGDNWTVETKDGRLAALFEDMVAVREKEPLVLTAD